MFPPEHPYDRHSDRSSFQIDRYRTEATALRRAAMQDASRMQWALKLAAVVGLLLGIVAVAPPKKDGPGVTADAGVSRTATQRAYERPALF